MARLPSQDADLKQRAPDTTVIPETVAILKVVESALGQIQCHMVKMLKPFVACQFQKRLPRCMFSQFHTARWVWDFVVIGALFWVTTFTPLQVVEKRHAIRRGIYDMECGYALVVRITRSL